MLWTWVAGTALGVDVAKLHRDGLLHKWRKRGVPGRDLLIGIANVQYGRLLECATGNLERKWQSTFREAHWHHQGGRADGVPVGREHELEQSLDVQHDAVVVAERADRRRGHDDRVNIAK